MLVAGENQRTAENASNPARQNQCTGIANPAWATVIEKVIHGVTNSTQNEKQG
ncbi:hypothetical protein [Pseudomonas savastanoi]|uniref:hypothetical protein n=1 Tax=Pseudomonas savastanoi TaxID=29438 RepID=UPI0019677894|nr:hypothetical protein [Pseudomonas savastanoi]